MRRAWLRLRLWAVLAALIACGLAAMAVPGLKARALRLRAWIEGRP